MYKIIGDSVLERSTRTSSHNIRIHDLGHGHLEALVTPHHTWSEVDVSPLALSDLQMAQTHTWVDGQWTPTLPPTHQELLDRAARNQERSTKRAKSKVRRLCKSKGLTTMLTLTYRENMIDRARMARDFDVFMKRLRRLVPGLEYVCVFERQKRGAWHAHIAVPRILSHYFQAGVLVRSYDLLRSMWRAVVGADNGNADVSRNRKIARSSARLASYLAKYIGKAIGDSKADGRDSYSASGKALPPPVLVRVPHAGLSQAIDELMALVSQENNGTGEVYGALLDGGSFFFSLSPKPS